jgi:hypothetical protein
MIDKPKISFVGGRTSQGQRLGVGRRYRLRELAEIDTVFKVVIQIPDRYQNVS